MEERRIHQLFLVSVAAKGLHAVLECAIGVALAFVSTGRIAELVNSLAREELIKDPENFFAGQLLAFAQNFSVDTKNFYVYYLLSHGIVKLLLVIGLLMHRLWAYPASLGALTLFIVYQVYRFYFTRGIGLIALTILDIGVMFLIWHEYGLVRRHLPPRDKLVKTSGHHPRSD